MTQPRPDPTPAAPSLPSVPAWASRAIPVSRPAPQPSADDFAARWETAACTSLHLIGELDLLTAPSLAIAVTAHPSVPAGPTTDDLQLRIELSRLRFLDLSGLTALQEGAEHLARLGWRVRLRSPQPQPRWLLLYASLAGWLPPGLLSGPGWGPEQLAAETTRCSVPALRRRSHRATLVAPQVPAQAGPQ